MNKYSEEHINSKSVMELIDMIENNYHKYFKEELPRVTKLSYTIRRVHGNTHPELHDVEKCFKDLVEQIDGYIEKEETQIFPNIRQYEKLNIKGNLDVMDVMANEVQNRQINIKEQFEKLRKLTNNNEAPDDGCQTFDLTYELYSQIEEVLKEQFEVEDKYLFPKLI